MIIEVRKVCSLAQWCNRECTRTESPRARRQVRLEEQAQVWGALSALRAAEGRRAARTHDAGRRKRRSRAPRPAHQLKRTRTKHHAGTS